MAEDSSEEELEFLEALGDMDVAEQLLLDDAVVAAVLQGELRPRRASGGDAQPAAAAAAVGGAAPAGLDRLGFLLEAIGGMRRSDARARDPNNADGQALAAGVATRARAAAATEALARRRGIGRMMMMQPDGEAATFQRRMEERLRLRMGLVKCGDQEAGLVCTTVGCPVCMKKTNAIRQRLIEEPQRLKQQIIIQFAYKFVLAKQQEKIRQIPLPEMLLDEITHACEELQRWSGENAHIISTAVLCYYRDVIWSISDNAIDDQRTAQMIVENTAIPTRTRFLLAAANCLSDKITLLWASLDESTKTFMTQHFTSFQPPPFKRKPKPTRLTFAQAQTDSAGSSSSSDSAGTASFSTYASGDASQGHPSFNPIIAFWIFRCARGSDSVDARKYCMHCIYYATVRDLCDRLVFFLSEAKELLKGPHEADYSYALDHAFHLGIEQGSKAAVYQLWRVSSLPQRESMISSAACCGTRNEFHAFSAAVACDLFEIVNFIWQRTSKEQHHGMLLASHCEAFVTAALQGSENVVQLMWQETTNNQKFMLLFAQNGLAFRGSCGSGHLSIVRILWEGAKPDIRKQLLTIDNCSALRKATANGHIHILEYLISECNSSDDAQPLNLSLLFPVIEAVGDCGAIRALKPLITALGPLKDSPFLKENRLSSIIAACIRRLILHAKTVNDDWEVLESLLQFITDETFRQELISNYPRFSAAYRANPPAPTFVPRKKKQRVAEASDEDGCCSPSLTPFEREMQALNVGAFSLASELDSSQDESFEGEKSKFF